MTHTTKIRVALAGAGGRMGRCAARVMRNHPRLTLVAAIERQGVPVDPTDLGSAFVTDDAGKALAGADVLIDFSAPVAALALAPACVAHGVAYLVASTAIGKEEQAAIDTAAKRVPVLQAANLSIGVNILSELVESAARKLGPAFEVEICEIHHHHKRDAPSGTALTLGRAVERGRGPLKAVLGRSGVGDPRAKDELGYAAVRGGDVAGEHTVYFFGESERIELTHRATSIEVFARGALVAALWLAGRAAGRYDMHDVLGT